MFFSLNLLFRRPSLRVITNVSFFLLLLRQLPIVITYLSFFRYFVIRSVTHRYHYCFFFNLLLLRQLPIVTTDLSFLIFCNYVSYP